ncbi:MULTISPECIES: HU family DNA-binding protein [unclassified Emergencia]|uniref:HU family DNA-binding protein n=1 Tax=unclassified Emergencia TaxID=2642996 RepID=UPI002ED3B781
MNRGDKMNKKELVMEVAQRTSHTQKDVDAVISSFLDVITSELQNGGKIQMLGFGSFGVKTRAERMAVNPKSGQQMIIPEMKVVAFKPGKNLKTALRKKD